MPLPQPVSALVTERLATVDAALPGFVTALRVTCSSASGDWRPDRSDVLGAPRLHAPPGG